MYQNKCKVIVVGILLFASISILFSSCRNPISAPHFYKIIFYANGGIIPGKGEVVYRFAESGESLAPLPAPTNRNFRFIGWFLKPCDESECDCPEYKWVFYDSTVWGDKTLYARWERLNNGGGGGPTIINPPADLDVFGQLQWLHEPVPGRVQGGANKVYVVTARAIFHLIETPIPGNNPYGINFPGLTDVYVRIVGESGARRVVEFDPVVFGAMLDVAATNTLTLENINLVGKPGNTNNPLIDVINGTLVMSNSEILDNEDGGGVRVTDGTFTMNAGAHVHNNNVGVELIGNNALLTMEGTAAEPAVIRNNTGRSGVLVNDGTIEMNTGSQIRNNDGFGVEMLGSNALLTMEGTALAPATIKSNDWRGVLVSGGGTIEMNAGARVEDNQGGGVYLLGSHLVMKADATIFGNNSTGSTLQFLTAPGSGGGVQARNTGFGASLLRSSVIMKGTSRVEHNQGGGSVGGGGVLLINSDLTMNGFTAINYNYSAVHSGGGVHLRINSTVRMKDDSQINRNESSWNGGGVTMMDPHNSRLYMYDRAQIRENRTESVGQHGAGVFISTPGSLFMIGNDTEISGNYRRNTGAAMNQVRIHDGTLQMSGGTIGRTTLTTGHSLWSGAGGTPQYGYGAGTDGFSPNGSLPIVTVNPGYINRIVVIDGWRTPP